MAQWGEIHRHPDMIALYHMNETSGTAVADEMGNYPATAGSNVNITSVSKVLKCRETIPPSNNDPQGDVYTIRSNQQIGSLAEEIKTVGVWCYPFYIDNVYSSYEQTLVKVCGKNSPPSVHIYKRAYWNNITEHLETTFGFGYIAFIKTASGGGDQISYFTPTIYPFEKPYYIFWTFKPSDPGTNNGWIKFYINFQLVHTYNDPNTPSSRWVSLIWESIDSYIRMCAPSDNPDANSIYQGNIDEVFISKELFTGKRINCIYNEWRGAQIIK